MEQLLRFEWDPAKAAENQEKHGVAFEEAASAFYDDQGALMDDPDHSDTEDRLLLLGMSRQIRVLVVCHCYREEDTVIRIISARKATRREQQAYMKRLKP
jgi:hypothetical protein